MPSKPKPPMSCAYCGKKLNRGEYMIAMEGDLRGMYVHRSRSICRAVETERAWRKLAAGGS